MSAPFQFIMDETNMLPLLLTAGEDMASASSTTRRGPIPTLTGCEVRPLVRPPYFFFASPCKIPASRFNARNVPGPSFPSTVRLRCP